MYDPAHPFGKKRYDRAIIDPVSCTGCGYCTMFCVMDCILLQPDGFYTVDLDRCIGCRSSFLSLLSLIQVCSIFLPGLWF